MDRTVVRYRFVQTVPVQELEGSLALAVVAAESLLGEATVQLDARFALDAQRRVCVIDVSTESGRAIARIFSGYVACEFGSDVIALERLNHNKEAAPQAA